MCAYEEREFLQGQRNFHVFFFTLFPSVRSRNTGAGYSNRRITAKLLDANVIALSRRGNPLQPPTSGANKVRRKVQRYPRRVPPSLSLPLSLSLSLSLSLFLSLDGVDRVRETGLERAPVNTGPEKKRENEYVQVKEKEIV